MSALHHVSILYYPAGSFGAGHFKLEVNGTAQSNIFYMGGSFRASYAMPLEDLIRSAKNSGSPFVRFKFSVTNVQLEKIQSYIGNSCHITCSQGALAPLIRSGIVSVPLPLTIFPLTSGLYLGGAKLIGAGSIAKVKLYRSGTTRSLIQNTVPGIAIESMIIIFLIAKISTIASAIFLRFYLMIEQTGNGIET